MIMFSIGAGATYLPFDVLKISFVRPVIFRANHASNYLPIGGRLPADKERLLETIRQAQEGQIGLKPEYLRGL